MKRFTFIIFIFILSNCSFDNKTGIWNNNNVSVSKDDSIFKDFETLNTDEETFNSTIEPINNFKPVIDKAKIKLKWLDEFYQNSNNPENFNYKNLNKLVFKSKKLSRYDINDKILFDGSYLIAADTKGNIILYSIEQKNIIYTFNFYKKKFKKIKKKLKLIIDKDIIYVADNIGYLYAFDYKKEKLLWAHNYKIPFRSNLKIVKDNLLVADQNNSLYIINKLDGKKIRIIPTEETILKNTFINSLAFNESSFFFLNTYGSLYSLTNADNAINWFLNLNQSTNLNASGLFYSKAISIHNKKIIITTNPYLYILDSETGRTTSKINMSSLVRPVASGQSLFLITQNNLLVSLNINTGKINYSLNINQKIADLLKTKKKSIDIKSLSLVNNELFIFLKNSYIVKFSVNGKIKKITKMPVKMKSTPIFINDSILYLNNKNQLTIVN